MQSAGLVLVLIKATVLLAAGLAAAAALRRAPAGARHAVWLATIGGVLVLPAMIALTPVRLEVLPPLPTEGAPAAAPVFLGAPKADLPPRSVSPARPTRSLSTANSAAAAPEPPTSAWAWPRPSAGMVLFGAWGAVAFALLARLAGGRVAVRRTVRGARALDGPAWPALLCDVADRLGLSDLPRLAASERVEIPFACGVWRVTIVLPAAAEGWSEERRRLVLFHELAHVRRRDLLGHMLGRVACAAYWFHPLAWIAARRLRAESERACDDLVLACGTRPSDYAGHLLEILSSARRTEALSAAVAMARRTEFEGRVLAILDPAAPRGVVGRLRSAALTAGLASVFLCVAALGPMRGAAPSTARAAEPEPAPQAPAQAQNPPAPAPPAVRAPAPERAAAPARAERRRDAEEDREEEEDQAEENESDAAPRPTAEQVALLTRVLRTDADASVRRSAAWALRSSGEPAAAALVAAVKGDADEGVREMAAWALADVRQADAAAALAAALKADQSEEVRAVAAWALGRQRQADRAALEAAAADRSARVREVAIWGLGNQRLEHAPAAVVTALGDADASVRTAAAWAVGQIGDPATAAPLRAAFKNEKDDEVRQAIFHAMVLMGERSPEVIAEVLQSKNPEMRALAVQVIGRGAGPWPWPWPRPDPRPYP